MFVGVLKSPEAVQLPAEEHDTADKESFGLELRTPLPNVAGTASAQVPLVWV